MVPEANITVVDTKTLSIGSGWQVAAAAKAIAQAGQERKFWNCSRKISDDCHSFFTLNELNT